MEVEEVTQVQTEVLITVEASVEELPSIDAAIRGYIQLLRFVVDPSHDRDEVIAQLRSFQRKYEQPLMDWRARQHTFRQSSIPTEPGQMVTWQATPFELLAFGTAVVGYLHMLETANAPSEVRSRMIYHLFTFEQRYMDQQANCIL